MIAPDTKPVTHHTPVSIPIHWQDNVKAGLDRDERLGILEPVPVGEPVTWCHRMVICVKKNGKPRRTVDMQSLKQHATKETHHTQSPYVPIHWDVGHAKPVPECFLGVCLRCRLVICHRIASVVVCGRQQ